MRKAELTHLQVEEALKIYKKALQYQKDGDRESAFKEYDALFNIEVLNLSQSTGLPPAAELLKYVAFKNHGLLLLSDLKHEKDEIEDAEFDERVDIVVDEFSEALLYDSDEDTFLELLYSVCLALGYFRIARLCLECIIESPSKSRSLFDEFRHGNFLTPSDYRVLKNYFMLCDKLGDQHSLNERKQTASRALRMKFIDSKFEQEEDVGWLSKTSESELKHHSSVYEGNIVTDSADWASLLGSLREFLVSLGGKSKRKVHVEDPYNSSLKPANLISISFPVAEVTTIASSLTPMEIDQTEQKEQKEVDPKAVDESSESVKPISETPPSDPAPKRKRRKSFDEAMRSRTSKRVRARADDKPSLEDIDLTEDEHFFVQLSSFLALCGEKFETVAPIFLNEECTGSDLYISNFKSLLQNWDDEHTETLAKMKTEKLGKSNSKKPLLSQLIDTSLSSDKLDLDRPSTLASSQLVVDFIDLANTSKFHVLELRLELIRSILRPKDNDLSPILANVWPLDAVNRLKTDIHQSEEQLGDFSRQVLHFSSKKSIHDELFIVQTIMELITDAYLQAMKGLRAPELHSKQALRDMELVRSTSPARYICWRRTFSDLLQTYGNNVSDLNSLILRHEWTNLLVQQVECEDSWDNLDDFLAFENDIIAVNDDIQFSYVNFPALPDLSLSSIRNQISRLKALSTLSRVFVEDVKNEKESDEDKMLVINTRISLLECVLMSEYQDDISAEYKTIADYFVDAPLKLRVKLWTILLSDYSNAGMTQKSLDGYLKLLTDTVQEFTAEPRESNGDQKFTILVRSIYTCHDIISKIMPLLQSEDFLLENVSSTKMRSYMVTVIKLLRMLHIFILYDDAIISNALPVPTHASWDKVSNLFKELIVRGWCLLYFVFRACVPNESKTPEILNDLLSIIHEQLGTRGYCGLGNGILLDISLKELMRLKFNESDADLLQCLHCRYGIVMGNDDFHPYDHRTKPEDIDKKSAIMLVDFVMTLVLRKKNMAQSILRADVKGVLDQLYEAIGLPDQSITAIEKNNFTLNNLLNSTLGILFLQECFYGRYNLELAPPPQSLSRLASSGFYYILGQTRMSLFKIRKRSLPGHTEDISEAIKFFKYDLMCGCSSRFETWFAMSQGYDALVEDDLTWNTYKINSASAREAVGIRQRKAIISCAIAVNCYLRNGTSSLLANTPGYQQLIGPAWSFFARLLYNSIQAPLEMEAYASDKDKLLCGPEGLYSRTAKYQIKPKVILKAALMCLRLAINETPNDWYNYYLKGKCLHQLKADPVEVLDSFCASISLCPEKPGSHGEFVLEPHYKLVSRVYKYLSKGSITAEVASKYLEKTQYREVKALIHSGGSPENDEVYGICVSTLAKIRAGDKKKWHHRPTYRIARIYDDCGDIEKAKEEMITFFMIKSTSKTPIHIWKTEFERPGQHFQYVNQYVKYFITLLERTNDVALFGILSKSLRKFVSGMIDHQVVWELLCTTVARMLKDQLGIPTKFNDNVIPQLIFSDFDRDSQRIALHVEKEEELQPMLKYLNYAAELRRLNNGFGSTAALDDLFVAIYLTIYHDFVKNIFPAEDSLPTLEAPVPEVLKEIAVTSTPNHSSTKISVMDLLSQPSTPVSKPSTPAPSESKASASTPSSVKIRVTRRDIISRSLALLRVALPKLIKGDNIKITTPTAGSKKNSPSANEADATSKANSATPGATTTQVKTENGGKNEGKNEEKNSGASPNHAKSEPLTVVAKKSPDQNGVEMIDISGDEVETRACTPVTFATNGGRSILEEASVVVRSSLINGINGNNTDASSGDVVKGEELQKNQESSVPRPKSKNSDWLSTIL